MIQVPTSIVSRQAIMVYSEYDKGSDSGEDRRTYHIRINERTETIVPTSGFGALNNLLEGNHSSHPNLNIPLRNRMVQYNQYSNFEAPDTQVMATFTQP